MPPMHMRTTRGARWYVATGALASCLLSCSGDDSGPAGPALGPTTSSDDGSPGAGQGGGGDGVMANRELSPARVRRLSADELHNSIRDVFFAGDDTRVGRLSEGQAAGFDNTYDELTVYLELMESLDALAAAVARSVVDDLDRILPCANDPTAQRACASSFVTQYGRRLYRRPLDAAEGDRLLDLYTRASTALSHEEGIATVTHAMLLSPHFLFRTELGGEPDAGRVVALTAYERAAALSYYLWRTTPDDALLDAADDGSLLTDAGMRDAISRMLEDPRAKRTLREFFLRWLQIDPIHAAKDDEGFTPELAASMQRETELFLDDLLFAGDGKLSALWTSTRSFADARLAALYGVSADARDAAHLPIELPSAERSGLLTHASFIASHTPSDEFSPIFIGALIRRNVLCQELVDPPATVPELPQEPDLSVREKLSLHRDHPACASCHELMDPIGFTFEKYSLSGAFAPSASERGLSGEGALIETDVDGPVLGAVALSQRLSQSEQVRECFAANVMQYLLGRRTSYVHGRTRTDAVTLDALLSGGFASGDMRRVFTEIVLTDSFLLRDATDLPSP